MIKRQFTKAIFFIVIIVIVAGLFFYRAPHHKTRYGVWIGLHPDDIASLEPYDTVVIDASYFSKEQIELLHQQGKTVYSYLNMQSFKTSHLELMKIGRKNIGLMFPIKNGKII